MTVLNSIIEWLKEFNPQECSNMKRINTDILPARVNSYSMVKEPTINKKTYISGKVVATEHYTLSALLPSFEDAERVANNEWGELLEKWVYEQNKALNFPAIDGATVKDIGVSTPFYRGKTMDDESVYQMTLSIKYEKEN